MIIIMIVMINFDIKVAPAVSYIQALVGKFNSKAWLSIYLTAIIFVDMRCPTTKWFKLNRAQSESQFNTRSQYRLVYLYDDWSRHRKASEGDVNGNSEKKHRILLKMMRELKIIATFGGFLPPLPPSIELWPPFDGIYYTINATTKSNGQAESLNIFT